MDDVIGGTMKSQPLVSVLMAVYNCTSTIEEAINSILNQTYYNWELIIYDDCSIDDTYEKALSISKIDNRIKVFKNERNLTLAPTLNRCLKEANGTFVARMDGDDICDSTRFEKQVEFLMNHQEFAVVSSLMKLYDDNGEYGLVNYKEYPQKEDFAYGSPICHAGCMIRRIVLEFLNGYSNSSTVERIEDYDLWIRLYSAGYKAYIIQEPLYSMRDDRNAIKRKKFKFRLSEYKLKKKMCKEFNLPLKLRLYCLKPIILGMIPSFLYTALHKYKYKR